jgi:hypothetical protein
MDPSPIKGLCMCSGQKCAFLIRYGFHFTTVPLFFFFLLHTLFKEIMDHRLQASRRIKDNSYFYVGVQYRRIRPYGRHKLPVWDKRDRVIGSIGGLLKNSPLLYSYLLLVYRYLVRTTRYQVPVPVPASTGIGRLPGTYQVAYQYRFPGMLGYVPLRRTYGSCGPKPLRDSGVDLYQVHVENSNGLHVKSHQHPPSRSYSSSGFDSIYRSARSTQYLM